MVWDVLEYVLTLPFCALLLGKPKLGPKSGRGLVEGDREHAWFCQFPAPFRQSCSVFRIHRGKGMN